MHTEFFFINYDGYSWGAFGSAFFFSVVRLCWLANEFLYIFGFSRLVFDIILCDIEDTSYCELWM